MTITIEHNIDQIETHPEDSLGDLATYVEFQHLKIGQAEKAELKEKHLCIVKLRGLLKGYDFSSELLAEARREMWQSLETLEP